MTILVNHRLRGQPMLVNLPNASASSPSSSLSAMLSLTNAKSTAVAVGAPITIGHSFAPRDVPAGSSVAISGMSVQQDQESYWIDGSLRFAALTLRDTNRTYGAIGGGADTQTMFVTASSSSPNRTAAFTLSQYLSTNDHKFTIIPLNGDGDRNTYEVSARQIVANGTLSPGDAGAVVLPNGCAAGATSLMVANAANISPGQSISIGGRPQNSNSGTNAFVANSKFGFVAAVSGNTVTVTSVTGAPTSGGPGVNLASNPNFAAANASPGYGAIANWTSSDTTHTGSSGNTGPFWDNANGSGAAGGATSVGFIQVNSASAATVSLSQTFAGLTIGQKYAISYLDNRRAINASGTLTLALLLDGSPIIAVYLLSAGGWTPRYVTFTATATSHTLMWQAANGSSSADNTALITMVDFTAGDHQPPSLLPAIPSGGTLFFNTPICGYEQIRSGPLCSEWKFWTYLRVPTGANAGKYHCQVRATLYVRAFGVNGPFDICGLLENSNVFANHPYGQVGPTTASSAQRFACTAGLYNGATPLFSWGGQNDTWAVTIPASDIAMVSSAATITPALSSNYQGGMGIQFQAAQGGTLPTGLVAGLGYWTDGNFLNTLSASHIYTDKQFVAGTFNYPSITGAGSGNVIVSPTVAVFGGNGAQLSTTLGERVWDPGTSSILIRPDLMPHFDPAYAIASKAIVPFDFSRTALARTSCNMSDRGDYADLSTFYPGQPQPWSSPWNISQYGDDPGDDRVGFVRQIDAECWFNQQNVYSHTMVRTSAARFWGYNFVARNERSGYPFCNTDGPNHDGIQYPGLGPVNGTHASAPETLCNAGQYFPFMAAALSGVNWGGMQDAYGPLIDASHLPCVGAGAYHRSGDRIYLDQMQMLAGTTQWCNANWNMSQNGTQYWSPITGENSEQTRGIAWRAKCFSQAEYYTPSEDLYQPYLRDALNYGGQYFTDYLAAPTSYEAPLGIFNVGLGANSNVPVYMSSFLGFSLAMIAWRDATENLRPQYKTFLSTYYSKFLLGLWDTDQGGGMYEINQGPLLITDSTGSASSVPTTISALWSFNKLSPTPTGSNPPIDNSSNNFRGSYPFDTDVYGNIAFSCWAMLAWAGVAKAQILCDRLHAILANSPYQPIVWSQPAGYYYNDGTTPQAFMPWCIRPPGVGGTSNTVNSL